MVAPTLTAPKKRKMGGIRVRIPLPHRLKIRALYVVQQLSPKDIGSQLGYTRQQVQGLIVRQGWCAVKKEMQKGLEKRHDAKLVEEVSEIQEAFAIKGEELGLKSLERLETSLDSDGPYAARDSQAYSQTAKNLYGIVRQARNLDTQQQEGKLGSVVVFLGDLPRVSREEKRVSPCVEVTLTPSTQCPALPLPSPKEAPISQGVIEDTGSGSTQQATD